MKNLKKIVIALFALFIFVPTLAFAQEKMNVNDIKEQIRETIDYSDSEVFGTKYMTRSTRASEKFAVYHRDEAKLSMADDAFDKSKSVIKDLGDAYEITLVTKPVSKTIVKTYYADCTSVKFVINGEEVVAEKIGEKKAVNSNKMVPEKFKITIDKEDLLKENLDGYNYYCRIIFETNIRDSGFAGKIAAIMMNPNARFFIK